MLVDLPIRRDRPGLTDNCHFLCVLSHMSGGKIFLADLLREGGEGRTAGFMAREGFLKYIYGDGGKATHMEVTEAGFQFFYEATRHWIKAKGLNNDNAPRRYGTSGGFPPREAR